MSTKRRASTRLAASATTAVTTETNEDDVDVAALGRAVKRLNTGAEREVEQHHTCVDVRVSATRVRCGVWFA